ncbi:MAG: response regulator [Bacillota bacterium]
MKYKYKILIVDGQEDALLLLKNLLEKEDCEVEAARNAEDAFEKIKNSKYHIAFIDADVPDMGGIELLKEIKSYDALTQVIMTAGHSTMEKILTSLEYGASDYITKPFKSMEHVMQAVDYSMQKLERWREAVIHAVNG